MNSRDKNYERRQGNMVLRGPSRHTRPEQRQEHLEVKEAILTARKLATHLRPDLDALLSVWLCQRIRKVHKLGPLPVMFIPANATGVEEGTLAVDVGNGKGLEPYGQGLALRKSSTVGSASMAIYRALPSFDRYVMESVVLAISNSNEKGENVHTKWLKKYGAWSDIRVRNAILTTNAWTMHRRLSLRRDDRGMLEWASDWFDGCIDDADDLARGKKAADDATYVNLLAILPFDAPPVASRFAYEKGAEVVLFSSNLGGDHWTLGLSRSKNAVHLVSDLRGFGLERFPGMRVHSEGISAGWVATSPLTCNKLDFEKLRVELTDHVIGVAKSPRYYEDETSSPALIRGEHEIGDLDKDSR